MEKEFTDQLSGQKSGNGVNRILFILPAAGDAERTVRGVKGHHTHNAFGIKLTFVVSDLQYAFEAACTLYKLRKILRLTYFTESHGPGIHSKASFQIIFIFYPLTVNVKT